MTKLDITIIGQDNIIYCMRELLEQAMEINDNEYEVAVLLKYDDGTEHYVPAVIGIDIEKFNEMRNLTIRYFENSNYRKFITLRCFDNIETSTLSMAYVDFAEFVKQIKTYIQLYTHDFIGIRNTRIFNIGYLGHTIFTCIDITHAKHNDYALKSLIEYLNMYWEKCDRKGKYVGVEIIWMVDELHKHDNTDCFKYLSDELRDTLIEFYAEANPEIVVYLIETASRTDIAERFKL
jgi:hypothetical protein